MRSVGFGLVVCSLFACKPSEKGPDTDSDSGKDTQDSSVVVDSGYGPDVNDLREDHPPPPEGGFQILTPTLEILPYEEIIYCYSGTYTGEDVGVVDFVPLTNKNYNHHSLLRTQPSSQVEDGTLEVCGTSMQDMFGMEDAGGGPSSTLFQWIRVAGATEKPGDWLTLPEGYAVKLSQGQRWLLDTHFINPTDQMILTTDAMNFGTVPASEVEHWVAAYEFRGLPSIPPGGEYTYSFDCTWPQDAEVLTVFGHMHERGTHFSVDWRQGSTSTTIYEVSDWQSEYRDNPRNITDHYAPGEFLVSEGDKFKVNCTWDNPTGKTLTHPDEMCSLHGAFGPSEVAFDCNMF